MIGNNPFIVDILLLSLFAWVFIFLCYVLGTFLFDWQSDNSSRRVFYNLTTGFLLLIGLFAVFFTRGKTINCVTILILSLVMFLKPKFHIKKDISLKPLVPFLYIVPMVFSMYAIYIYGENVHSDVKYYSKIVFSLWATGQENFYHFYNLESRSFNGMVPYHYLEMWLAAIFNSVTQTPAIYALKNFAYPFLISLVSFGFMGLLNSKSKSIYFVLFILASTFPLGRVYGFFDTTGWTIFCDMWLRPNLISYYLLIILLIAALLDDNWFIFYVFVSIGLTFSVIIVPGLMAGIISLELYKVVVRKSNARLALRELILPFCSLLTIAFLYTIFKPAVNISLDFGLQAIMTYNLSVWKALIGTFLQLCLEVILPPVLVVVLCRYFKKSHGLPSFFLIFMLSNIVSSLLLFQLLTPIDNSYQFAYFGYALSGFSIIYVLIYNFSQIRSVIFRFALALVFIIFMVSQASCNNFILKNSLHSLRTSYMLYENVSESWANQFDSYLKSHHNLKGGFVNTREELKSILPPLRQSLTRQPGNYLCYFTDDSNLLSITCENDLFFDRTPESMNDFKKLSIWTKVFPYYLDKCNPEAYIRSGQLDYFMCSSSYPLDDSSLKVIRDPRLSYKLVYR